MDAFCKLCEEAVVSELITAEECQYWVFEHGYQSANESMVTFSKLCDEADKSDLISAIDCQYWLFQRGYLAAKSVRTDLSVIAESKKMASVKTILIKTNSNIQ